MNLLASIYCNQYFELKQKGKEASARYNGTILTTFALVLVLFAIYILLVTFLPDVEKEMNRFVRKTVGRTSGRLFGKILAGVLMVVSYLGIRYTLGTEKRYQKMIQTFEKLPFSVQEQISKKGLKTFIAAIVFIGIALLSLLIKTYI
ncbi:MAG: hypothetical protein AAF611_09045 [Bacteroidota bacterium]